MIGKRNINEICHFLLMEIYVKKIVKLKVLKPINMIVDKQENKFYNF